MLGVVTTDDLPIPDEADLRGRLAPLAQRFGWRLVVLFGSAARRSKTARDLDLAVVPERPAGLMERGRWLAALEEAVAPQRVDLLVVDDAVSPLARFEVFRDGRCLYEAEPGLFWREQDRAFFLYADSGKFRRAAREMLDDRP
jgi:predicted nucleotidyltransferase